MKAQRFFVIGIPLWFGIGLFAVSLKFATFLDHWVYFPSIPDAFDLIFVMAAAAYLLHRAYCIWRHP